jgi:hypothetical protein
MTMSDVEKGLINGEKADGGKNVDDFRKNPVRVVLEKVHNFEN